MRLYLRYADMRVKPCLCRTLSGDTASASRQRATHGKAQEWLLVRSAGTGEAWIAWAERQGDVDILRKPSGELVVHDERHHEVLGVIAGVLTAPPRP